MGRYVRNYSSITKEEQAILNNTRVAIVGLGGLGGYVLENLVRLGVKSFNLIDRDVFEVSNLNRQILSTENNLGLSKAEEGFRRAKSIDRNVDARVFSCELDENSVEMLEGVDIVVDCLDSIDSRLKLEKLCDKMNLTLIHGAIRGYYGQVAVSSPKNRIFNRIYGGLKRDDESLGNLPMTCMVTASLQVNLLLKVIFNEELDGDLILIDVKNMEMERLKLQ
ncbi:MAG: HesA/MoeB/ThiF family protein [Tissierellia bacterium]|nr:HesA/MoeB/ThiF family protein [Tissierellia bacterium]